MREGSEGGREGGEGGRRGRDRRGGREGSREEEREEEEEREGGRKFRRLQHFEHADVIENAICYSIEQMISVTEEGVAGHMTKG